MKVADMKAALKKIFTDKTAEIDALDLKDDPEPPKTPQAPEPKKDQVPIPGIPPEMQAVIDAMTKQNETLAAQIKEMNDRHDAASKSQHEKDVDAVINQAIADRKIPATNKEMIASYKTLVAANLDAGKTVIASLPQIAKTAPVSTPSTPTPGAPAQTPSPAASKQAIRDNALAAFAVTDASSN
jgi:hypothetical protein